MVRFNFDMNSPVQTDFRGLGAVYHAFAGMPDDAGRVYTQEQCELEAARAADMRVKVVRSYHKWYAWDNERKCWDWENAQCRALYAWLSRMKKAGIEVALNTGWVNCGDLQGDHWGGPSPFKVEGDWDATVRGYAEWVSRVYTEIVEKRGFDNVKYFVLFTEPNERSYPTLPFENADYRELWYDCAYAAHCRLLADGKRDKISLLGPQEGLAARPWFTEWAIKEKHIDEWLDGISLHNYLLFRPADPSDIQDGNRCWIFPFAGCRAQQEVKLEKNTDYTVSVWLKFKQNVPATENSAVHFGIFGKGSFDHYFTDYCEVCDGIETRAVRLNELADEWRRFELCFNSGENENVKVGIYSDIRRADGKKDSIWEGLPFARADGVCLLVDNVSLKKVGDDREMLKDHSLEHVNGTDWYILWAKPYGIDAYEHWESCEKDAIAVLPEGKKKNYWHDEYNVQFSDKQDTDYGIYLALGQVAMMNCGGQGSFLWTLFDQQWPNNHTNSGDSFYDGDHRCGLMPTLFRSKTPYPAYYAWGLVSRYTGGRGTHCFEGVPEGEGKVVANLNRLPDGNLTVTVVNYSDTRQDITLSFGEQIGRTFYRHRYIAETVAPDDRAQLPPCDAQMKVEDAITDTLPAMSVAIYTTLDD